MVCVVGETDPRLRPRVRFENVMTFVWFPTDDVNVDARLVKGRIGLGQRRRELTGIGCDVLS